RRIHCVGEGDRIQAVLLRILHKFGGDKEDDRHVAFFAGLEPLIGKTEAIDLREICASGGRRDVVSGNSYGLAGRLVEDPIADGNDVPDLDVNGMLLRLEAPRQTASDVRIETDFELAPEDLGGSGGGELGCAAESGRAAEPVIQWHGCIGCAHHCRNEYSACSGDHDISTSLR